MLARVKEGAKEIRVCFSQIHSLALNTGLNPQLLAENQKLRAMFWKRCSVSAQSKLLERQSLIQTASFQTAM